MGGVCLPFVSCTAETSGAFQCKGMAGLTQAISLRGTGTSLPRSNLQIASQLHPLHCDTAHNNPVSKEMAHNYQRPCAPNPNSEGRIEQNKVVYEVSICIAQENAPNFRRGAIGSTLNTACTDADSSDSAGRGLLHLRYKFGQQTEEEVGQD